MTSLFSGIYTFYDKHSIVEKMHNDAVSQGLNCFKQGEVVELRPSSSKPRGDLLVVGDIRKAKSTDNINLRANQRIVRISQPPNLLKCIFKGENPDKVKTVSLNERKPMGSSALLFVKTSKLF